MAQQDIAPTDNGADSLTKIEANFTELYEDVASAQGDITDLETVVTPASSSSPASLDLHEDTDNGTHKITVTAPDSIASDKVLTLPDETGIIVSSVSTQILTGWIPVADSWAYASADAPTFTITVPSGAASIYGVGMRIKLTQTTVKYFIITAVADTVLTVYGGTDYTLVNAAISAISYSAMKIPLGFPISADKWTIETTDVLERVKATPTVNTWYNTGSKNIVLPIGEWNVSYQCLVGTHGVPIAYGRVLGTLSTGSSTESDTELTGGTRWSKISTDGDQYYSFISRQKNIAVASKTTMYMNHRVTEMSGPPSNVLFENQVTSLVIRAVCSYL
jgi:hypothetical protein